MDLLMNHTAISKSQRTALMVLREQFTRAIAATKCHGCGCMLDTIEALAKAAPIIEELGPVIDDARRVLVHKKYDCLGCKVCYPAVAANVFAEAFPNAILDGALCPTDTPTERSGWPPLPGDYSVVRYGASVAVCTLNSDGVAKELTRTAPDGLAIVGTMHTENLGIERVIRNVLANPNIRFLILCGQDTRQLIGHLPGQSMESLFAHGVDEQQRIIGAKGKRPFLKNVSSEHMEQFQRQVELVSMIGKEDVAYIAQSISEHHAQGMPPFGEGATVAPVETIRAKEPQLYRADPAGFFVVFPDRRVRELVVEHYTNAGVLDCVIQGATPTAVYAEIVTRGLVSQLDHAAYLGRELATAERTLQTGAPYIQDRAPGELMLDSETSTTTDCGPNCTSCH